MLLAACWELWDFIGSQKWRKGRDVCAIEQVDPLLPERPNPPSLPPSLMAVDAFVSPCDWWERLLKRQVSLDTHTHAGGRRNKQHNSLETHFRLILTTLELGLFFLPCSETNKEQTPDPDFYEKSSFYEKIQSEDKYLTSFKPEISTSHTE